MLLSGFYNMDCLEAMREFPDKFFSLAIIDPPYGIGASEMTMGKGAKKKWAKDKSWDSEVPDETFFNELFRVSERQIIWGGNYFNLPLTGGWIFWDKQRDKDVSFSDGELAWTSFLNVLKKAPIRYDGFIGRDAERIHITQKPIALYTWLLTNYAHRGDKILDTHVGSASSLIACHRMGFEYWGFELDKSYFQSAAERLEKEKSMQPLFEPSEVYKQEKIDFE